MTTKEIIERLEAQNDKLTTEINKVKSHCTRLSKALVKNEIEVPVPNWSEEPEMEEEEA